MKENADGSAAATSVLLIHLRWSVADAEASPLNEEMLNRLRSYLPRYAETLSARCLVVGGVHDHLHLLLDLPVTRSLQEVEEELRRASQRFLRDVLGSHLFLWSGGEGDYRSVSPLEQEAVVTYIRLQSEQHAAGDLWDGFEAASGSLPSQATESAGVPDETLPEWLRAAMSRQTK
jgi:REP element-mobilizing transposase RayT